MRTIRYYVFGSIVVWILTFSASKPFDSTVCRRILQPVSLGLEHIPPSEIPVVDSLDGVVKIGLVLGSEIDESSEAQTAFVTFIRALGSNADIEVSKIFSEKSASELARILQDNKLGPWRGVIVTAEGNELVISGVNTEVRIPVYSPDSKLSDIDVLVALGSNYELPETTARRFLAFTFSPTLEDGTLPGEVGESTEANISLSLPTIITYLLKSLQAEFGPVYPSRVNIEVPEGSDLEIRPNISTTDLTQFLRNHGIQVSKEVELSVTGVSEAIRGASYVEMVLTLPGKVTKEQLQSIFQTTPGLSVAPEKKSTSAMFTNPSDTSLLALDPANTQLSQQDGYTRVTLRGWISPYAQAGIMVSTITEVGQRLSELGLLSAQETSWVYPRVEHPKVKVVENPIRVMINGAAGRIGLNVLRSAIGDPNFNVVAVNGVRSAEALRQGLLYDEILGPTGAEITIGKEQLGSQEVEYITINGHKIYVFNARDEESIKQLPLGALGVECLLETSGRYTTRQQLQPFFDAGVQWAAISAPAKDKTLQIVPGVNHDALVARAREGNLPDTISAGSCTTNNTAPAIKAIVEFADGLGLEVKEVELTTIHALTNTQAHALPRQVRDPKKAERDRAGVLNIVPTSTGAAKVLPEIMTGIDRMHGIALRVGNPNGSASRLIFYLDGRLPEGTTPEQIVQYLKDRASGDLRNIMVVNEGSPLNSLAINGSDITSIIEASTVRIVPIYNAQGEHVSDAIELVTWYDNEWGYTQQYLRAVIMHRLVLERPGITSEELLWRSDRLGSYSYSPVPVP